ncbi:universal stress protein [Kitasatospora kifunensis]|uniref:Nucleotide-binding universal stress UspA family protein n=1 Tax=Kitasatospora kifunensis TaxID=58351 RepID=A0A7W7R9P1_KITKI|nr:universal stress protein [Kitasatospora kifunensis]MBB4927653.1 nucleotide-binding universal stress UspA family protein [Kitasatospora kifunensis]
MSTTVQRVVVGVDGSAGSLAALRIGLAEAERHGAVLRPVLALVPPGGEIAERRWPSPPELQRIWTGDARVRLLKACGQVLPEGVDGVEVEPEVVRGAPGAVLVDCAPASTDLLVLGACGHGTLSRLRPHSVSRYCLRHANCPVLVVHPDEAEEPADGGRAEQ